MSKSQKADDTCSYPIVQPNENTDDWDWDELSENSTFTLIDETDDEPDIIHVEDSSHHLGSGTIHSRINYQGVIDKFLYLQRKMELEQKCNVEAVRKEKKGKRRACNNRKKADDNTEETPIETNEEIEDSDVTNIAVESDQMKGDANEKKIPVETDKMKGDVNMKKIPAKANKKKGYANEKKMQVETDKTKGDDNVKEIPAETNEEKGGANAADDNQNDKSITSDTRRHKARSAGYRRNNKKKENSTKGTKERRNSCDSVTEKSKSLKQSKIRIEQEKLYNKLKDAAMSPESSFYESDCETENKLFDKSDTLEGSAKYYDRSVSPSKKRIEKASSKDFVTNISEVTNGHCNDKSVINGVKNNKKGLDEKRKIDWREQLLLLEMNHNEFDDNADSAENHASDHKGKNMRKAGRTRSKDLNANKNSGKVKRTRTNSKNVMDSKVKDDRTLIISKNSKDKRTRAKNVLADKGHSRQALSDQVKDVRKSKKSKVVSKDLEDHAMDNRACIRLISTDSAVSCSSTNQKNERCTNSSEDLRLSLDASAPLSASTPLKNYKIPKIHAKKKTCKRKIKMVPSGDEVNDSSVIKDKHDVVGETSSLNLSLPTPRQPRADYNPFSLSYNEEKVNDDCSSDEDLPAGITPLKIEKTISENDIVWVKWKKWPQLPALVRKVYKKKKRVTCAVFIPNGFEDDFTMSYTNQGSVIPYCDVKKDEILACTKEMPVEDQTFFRACCAAAETYLTKEAIRDLESTRVFKENITQEADVEEVDDIEVNMPPCRKRRKLSSDCVITKIENHSLSKQGQLRVEKMAEKTKPLTEFLVSETTKDYLEKIYNGSQPSELHDKFLSGTIRERDKMKHRGFGPIDDDDQIELLLNTFLKWIKQINKKTIHEINYVFDVWVPEAVVFAFRHLKGYGQKRAWEKFNKGVKRTKEELQIMHNDLIDVDKANKLISDKRIDFVLK